MKKYQKLWTTPACTCSLLVGLGLGLLLFGGHAPLADEPPPAVDPLLAAMYNRMAFPEYAPETVPVMGIPHAPELYTHRYVVTAIDGYVAVLYAEHIGGGVKEITSSLVSNLPWADVLHLNQGIRIYTEEALHRLLQDYGS